MNTHPLYPGNEPRYPTKQRALAIAADRGWNVISVADDDGVLHTVGTHPEIEWPVRLIQEGDEFMWVRDTNEAQP